MDNSIERNLLEFLDSHPFEKYADIKAYFKSTYPNHAEHPMDFKVVLDECIDQNLIRLADQEGYKKLGTLLVGYDEYVTLNNLDCEIKGKIKMTGRSWLNEQKRLENQDSINTWQKYIAIGIGLFTALQAIVATCTYIDTTTRCANNEANKECRKLALPILKTKKVIDSIYPGQIADSVKTFDTTIKIK